MKHIHLIGIGGTGMSSIARVLLEKGYTVSGSDRNPSTLAQDLQRVGAQISAGHSESNIHGADIVVRSSAIPDDNVEVQAALKAGIPVLKRSDFLSTLMEGQDGIAIAGTHGKTTTTAMLAYALYSLDYDPSYILGGVSKNLGTNAHAGKGRYFVIEADEYDRMFLGLTPQVILVTNVEYDHPDIYPNPANYHAVFEQFIGCLKPGGLLITNFDDPGSTTLANFLPQGARAFSCGLKAGADYRAENIKSNTIGGSTFLVTFGAENKKREPLTVVSLQLPGEHNVRNALAVIAALHQLSVPVQQASQNLAEFKGTGRRFDIVGEANGITVIDDYAHHPTKIRATLAAARSRFPIRRLVAVWQPHTFSRTELLANEFIDALSNADLVLITEVYAAREKSDNFSAKSLVEKIDKENVIFTPTIAAATDYLLWHLVPGDVLVVLSAGDADQICFNVLNKLKERNG